MRQNIFFSIFLQYFLYSNVSVAFDGNFAYDEVLELAPVTDSFSLGITGGPQDDFLEFLKNFNNLAKVNKFFLNFTSIIFINKVRDIRLHWTQEQKTTLYFNLLRNGYIELKYTRTFNPDDILYDNFIHVKNITSDNAYPTLILEISAKFPNPFHDWKRYLLINALSADGSKTILEITKSRVNSNSNTYYIGANYNHRYIRQTFEELILANRPQLD